MCSSTEKCASVVRTVRGILSSVLKSDYAAVEVESGVMQNQSLGNAIRAHRRSSRRLVLGSLGSGWTAVGLLTLPPEEGSRRGSTNRSFSRLCPLLVSQHNTSQSQQCSMPPHCQRHWAGISFLSFLCSQVANTNQKVEEAACSSKWRTITIESTHKRLK